MANVMVYASSCTNKFYLSRDKCTKLGTINSDFPCIDATIQICAVHKAFETCDSMPRTPPGRSDELSFTCKQS